MIKFLSILSLVSFIFVLSACDSGPDQKILLANAQAAVPSDAKLAKIYQRSCKACHATAETTAPLAADVAAWQPRLDKGMDVLLDSVINGFAGMPPFGLCMDCSAEEFEQLIQFMSQPPVK